MQWASSVSQFPDPERAAAEACESLREKLRGAEPDLLTAFISAHYGAALPAVAARLRREFQGGLLLGCSAQSVIGGGREVEDGPGLSLTGAVLPDVELRAFHCPDDRAVSPEVPSDSDFLLLGDPFSEHLDEWIDAFDRDYPGRTKMGGIASGGHQPGECLLMIGDDDLRSGAIGVALRGKVRMESVVAQGCRPVGNPFFVTRAEGNTIHELDGSSPIEPLTRLFEEASDARERALLQNSLFLGVAMKDTKSEYAQGDYLIRNLLGVESETGALHVGALLEPRQIVQFHVRDAHTADADLTERLSNYQQQHPAPEGALLFSCVGRGQGLYGVPDHDCKTLREQVGDFPVGGFFGNGEIGPVGNRTFRHGYTSAFALFHTA